MLTGALDLTPVNNGHAGSPGTGIRKILERYPWGDWIYFAEIHGGAFSGGTCPVPFVLVGPVELAVFLHHCFLTRWLGVAWTD